MKPATLPDSTEKPRGLVCFDLDGTLLRRPTICEMLAEPLGHAREMLRFEGLSDEADIAEARAVMVRWYKGRSLEELRGFLANPTWASGAKEAVTALQAEGVRVAIASYTWRFGVELIAAALDVSDVLGSMFAPDGGIEHVWARDKAAWLQALSADSGLPRSRVAAVGDSRGDVDMLRAAGFAVCVGPQRLPGIEGLVHMPGADLREVAEVILSPWKT